jgi:hypothetical protein
MSDQFINLGVEISRFGDSTISTESSNTVISFINFNDLAIDPTVQFGDIQQLDFGIDIPSIAPTAQFGTDYNWTFLIGQLQLITIEPTTQFGEPQLNVSFDLESIDPTVLVATPSFLTTIDPTAIAPTVRFGDVNQLEVFFDFTLDSVEPTVQFGEPQLNRFLITTSIESTAGFGTANVFYSSTPDSIASTVQFGPPSINRPVHRSLIFKDDKITKLGGDDDVEIASGVIIRTGTAALTGNTVPGVAAGYITVVINGTDYVMPFFNL